MLDWLRNMLGPVEQRGSLENPSVSLSDADVWGEHRTGAGVNVTPKTAMQVPAVYAAVQFWSNTFAALPLILYRRDGNQRSRDTDSPLWRVLHDAPNDELTSYQWRKWSMQQQLLRGRSYTLIRRRGDQRAGRGVVNSLFPLNPDLVTVRRDESGSRIYEYRPDGPNTRSDRVQTFAANQIIDVPHIFGDQIDEHDDPTKRLKESIGLSIQLERFAGDYFRGGGTPPLSLEGPFESAQGMQRAGKQINQRIASREGNVLVIPQHHKLNQVGYNPEQSQLEQARRFQVEEAARIFGLPPTFLQDLTRSSFANASQQDMHFVKHSLTQVLTAWEQELNLKLFGNGRRNRFVEFNVDGLLRGEFKTRMDGMAQAVQNALLTPNEGRAMENRPPLPGGDSLHLQQNMEQLELLNTGGGEEDEPPE